MIRLVPAASAVFGLALLGGCASSVVVDPAWTSIPSAESLGEAYPQFASMIGMEGAAILRCTVALEGRLANCRVREAAPEGMGFDRAALSQASQFRVQPRLVDGEAAKSQVQFTVRFALEAEEPVVPWPGSEPTPEHLALARRVAARYPTNSGVGPADLDVDPDRAVWVADLIEQVDDETATGMREAMALAMARLLSRGELEILLVGQRRPSPPADKALFAAANDRFMTLSNARRDRVRAAYCARFSCSSKLRARSPRHADEPPARQAP